MNRSKRNTRNNRAKDENLRFLLNLCKKETKCANCGIFKVNPEKKSVQPLLAQKRSKDFEVRLRSYWGKKDLSGQSPKPILAGKGETVLLLPLVIQDELFGFFASYFLNPPDSLSDEKYGKLVLFSQQIRTCLENLKMREWLKSKEEMFQAWQEDLFQMRKMASVGELTRDFAHDINNPLQVVLGKAQILGMRMGKDPNNSAYVDELKSIEKNAQRISCLLSKLSDFARRSEKSLDSASDVNLGHLLERTFLLVKTKFRSKGIEFQIKSQRKIPSVKGNPHQLEQVFLDLFLNAQKAMPQGGRFTVSVKKEKDFLKLDFSDSGETIPREILPKVFDPVLFTPDLKKRLHPGLLLSDHIIQEHKGQIEIMSHKDKGNTFRLRLPII